MADTIKITTLAQLKVALQAAKTYIDGLTISTDVVYG